VEPGEMKELDATRQTLGRLPQKLLRGAPEKEESCCGPRAVRQYAKQGKQVRTSLDLVQNHETFKFPECKRGLIETSQIRRILEVEAGRGAFRPFACDLFRQRRFPHLPGAQDSDDRVPGEQGSNLASGGLSIDHLHARILP
jgi:hypothetical protein